MFSLAAQPMSSGQGGYYFGLAAKDDYYLKAGEEPPGLWLCRGAEELGLSGRVEEAPFMNLLDGFSPDRLRKLVQNAGKENHRAGWESVFSAPKSVSVLWGTSSDAEIRKAIEEAQWAAVKCALKYLEDKAGFTRLGHGGVEHEHCRLIVAAFPHSTSRSQDPNIHTHCLFLAVGVRQDGRTSAIESRYLYQHKTAAGALYRAELAAQLEQRLGVEIVRQKSWFEVKGVPESLCKELSKRRSEIETELQRRGVSTSKAADIAALETRQKKEGVAREELYQRWEEVAEKHGFTRDEVLQNVLFRAKEERSVAVEGREALTEALDQLTNQKSHFTERELVQYVSQSAQTRGIGGEAVLKAVSEYTAGHTFAISPHAVIPLGPDRSGEQRYTTSEVWKIEKELLTMVERSRGNHSHELRAASVRGVLLEQKLAAASPSSRAHELNSEQKAALRHVTRGSGSIAVVSGMAGTGKTTLLDAVRRAYEKEGYEVVGACVAAKAARGLEAGSGISSRTVASFIAALDRWENGEVRKDHSTKYRVSAAWKYATYQIDWKTAQKWSGEYYKPTSELKHEWLYATHQISSAHKRYMNMKLAEMKGPPPFQLTDKHVIVLDEAGMLSSKQLRRLISAAEKYGAKTVMVGDHLQLQAIGCGAPLKLISDKIGCAELKEIRRQKGPDAEWQIPAIHNFAAGRAIQALQAYDDRGYLTTKETKRQAREALIDAWKREGVSRPEENLIFCGERADVRELNRLAQAERLAAGKLTGPALSVNGHTFYKGDRVLVTENAYKLGVRNGDLGTIIGLNAATRNITMKLDDTGEIVKLNTCVFNNIQPGYSVTTHKGQGATVQNAFVLAGGVMQDSEITYVQASRAVKKTHYFTDEATLELAREMSRSRQNRLAHELAQPGVQEQQRL